MHYTCIIAIVHKYRLVNKAILNKNLDIEEEKKKKSLNI